MKDMFYLFKNNKVIKKSQDIEELKQDILEMQLHIDTAPYYCDLKTVKGLDDFSDIHEGVWFPVCNLLNENNQIEDVFIVRDFYAYQDKNWEKAIEKFNND